MKGKYIKKIMFLLLFVVMFSCCIGSKRGSVNEIAKGNTDEDELLSFMVYGSDFLISVALPETWTVDMNYAQQVGVNGFFYQKKYSINDSQSAIILQLAYKPNEEINLEDWIDYDLDAILDYYEGSSFEKMDWNVHNKNGYRIIVYDLKVGKIRQQQYVSYFDVGLNYFAKIYVTILDKNIHNDIVDDYRKCLENSEFTGIGIKMN
jgi:hypothetical protein